MTTTIPHRASADPPGVTAPPLDQTGDQPPNATSALLAVGAGANYNLLYLTAAALTFLGALAIIPVRKVR